MNLNKLLHAVAVFAAAPAFASILHALPLPPWATALLGGVAGAAAYFATPANRAPTT